MVMAWGVWSMRDAASGTAARGERGPRCGHGVRSARQRATTLACGGTDCPIRACPDSRLAPSAERANMQPPPRKVSDHFIVDPVELTESLNRSCTRHWSLNINSEITTHASLNSIALYE